MIFKSGGVAAAIAVAFLSAGSLPAIAQEADAAQCGTDRTIDIAEMSWPSAAALAHIHATILEKGFGCDVEIVAGDTVPTSSSMMTRGTPAVAPELWTSAIEEPWAEAIAEGTVVELSDAITDGTVEGWFIPQYTQDANPELTTAEAVIARPDLFPDPEDNSQGRIYSCPPGWACELSTTALFEAFDMEETWNLFGRCARCLHCPCVHPRRADPFLLLGSDCDPWQVSSRADRYRRSRYGRLQVQHRSGL
jgi:glycine betaine/proline transport system substrate-binding protein